MELSLRQWIALSTLYLAYIIFGAVVFYRIERKAEIAQRTETLRARSDVNELLIENVAVGNLALQTQILAKLSNYCGKPMTNYTGDNELAEPYKWSFYHAILFAFVVCSTLGYGITPPTTKLSRYCTVAYFVIGIPMNGILFAHLGNCFRSGYTSIYERYKAKKADCDDGALTASQLSLVIRILFTLIPASVLLIFLPSCIFCFFEGWSYTISVYYCLETLTMIGLGDYIPTFQPHQQQTFGIYFLFYQIFILAWLMFGLTYFMMLITLIAEGMQSNQMARLNEKLKRYVLSTHNRIWNGILKDLGSLRSTLTEAYVMKAVEDNFEHRTASCPDLTMFPASTPLSLRKRSRSIHVSEAIQQSIAGSRPVNLKRIQDDDLLMEMINALAAFEEHNAPQLAGTNLFSDSDILKDENEAGMRNPNYGWGRLMKHMDKLKRLADDSARPVENDTRPMSTFEQVVQQAMSRRRQDDAADGALNVNAGPSTGTGYGANRPAAEISDRNRLLPQSLGTYSTITIQQQQQQRTVGLTNSSE